MTPPNPSTADPEVHVPPLWTVVQPDGPRDADLPVLTTAIHAGHAVHPAVRDFLALPEADRLRQEDPGTARIAELGVTRVVVNRSRFEVDLNRPLDGAVYADPEAAWGLEVWKGVEAPAEALARGRREHREFYAAMEKLLASFEARWGRFVVYDVHSYNHRRGGPGAEPDDPAENPEINVGTGALIDGGDGGRERWAPVVERFIDDLRAHEFQGRRLDVRENVRFRGGHFPRWVAERFPESACPLAIEVKKIYMDEWTGRIDSEVVRRVREALAATLPGVTEALEALSAETGAELRAGAGGG